MSLMDRSVVGAKERLRRASSAPEGDDADALSVVRNELQTQSKILRAFLRHSTATLDAIVWDHKTVACDTAAATVSIDLVPQTSQIELIEGALFNLHLPAGASVTVSSAFMQLDSDYYGMAGMIASPFYPSFMPMRALLSSTSVRHGEVDITGGNFPAGAYFSFALFGRAIPGTLAETLH